MDEIVKSFKDLKSTHRYYCDECKDTGKIETLRYTGKDIGYMKTDQEVIGWDRFAKMCWNYQRSIVDGIPEFGKFFFDNFPAIDAYVKSTNIYNASLHVELVSVNPCSCKRGNWTKEKKQYD
jgi:hypothetical protein